MGGRVHGAQGRRHHARLVGLKYECLRAWSRNGLLVPSLRPPRGRGRPVLYSIADLLTARVVRELGARGLPHRSLSALVPRIRQLVQATRSPAGILVVSQDRARFAEEPGQLLPMVAHHPEMVWIIDMRPIQHMLIARKDEAHQSCAAPVGPNRTITPSTTRSHG